MCVTVCIGRAVGIGAYLARLGRRTIQVAQTPIILTGQAALNKVLGKDVYESNAQLGGPQIMHQNGVTHLTASNCLEAMRQACCRCDRYPDGYDGACGTRRPRGFFNFRTPNSAPWMFVAARLGGQDGGGARGYGA